MKLLTFRDDVKAVVESTGNLWIQIHDVLEKPRSLKVFSQSHLPDMINPCPRPMSTLNIS